MSKLYPDNTHQNHYEDWHYLGNDRKHDYYVLPWELVGKDNRFTMGVPWLSIVHSNEPSDYESPCYNLLLSNNQYRTVNPRYALLAKMLREKGYHLTGRE